MTLQCAQCATPVPDDARFCSNCGSLVSDAEGQAAATGAMDESSTAAMEKLLRKDTQGHFEIREPIGRGGMAAVYLAWEIHLSRLVAIKVLPPELTFGHGTQRFIREAKTAAALEHPNIINIYRVTTGSQIFWYAMTYLEGQSLDHILKEKQQFTVDEVIEILRPVADALDYAHEHDVIHRDIKPANIMLDKKGRVVVTDFGIAKALTEGTLTDSGSVVGTPYYMSPEQGMGQPVTGASDQYSLAVMAYEMLCGQRPFDGESAVEILHKHVMVDPPPLDVLRAGLPDHLYRAVHKALRKKAEERFESVTAFIDAMTADWEEDERPSQQSRISTELMPKVEQPAGGSARPTSSTRKWMAIGAGGMLTAAVAATAVLMTQTRSAPSGDRQTVLDDTTGQVTLQVPGVDPDTSPAPIDDTPGPIAPGPPDPVATTGTISVTGAPTGFSVSVDGGAPRRATQLTLNAGLRILSFSAPDYEPYADTIQVTAGQRTVVNYRGAALPAEPTLQMAEIFIVADIAADIYIDDEMKRTGSRHREQVLPGTHVLRLVRDGFEPVDSIVTVSPGQTLRVNMRLRRNDDD